jgi:predicted dehydrogenase
MTEDKVVQAAIIGCGSMARHHIPGILRQLDTTHIAVVCEPSSVAYAATAEVFREAGVEPPPNQPSLDRMLAE